MLIASWHCLETLLYHDLRKVFASLLLLISQINSTINGLLASGSQSPKDELAASTQTKRIRNLELLKLEMLQIVTASPDYLVLSLPNPKLLPDAVHPINQAAYFTTSKHKGGILTDSTYQRLHFLPAVLLGEIQTCLLHS